MKFKNIFKISALMGILAFATACSEEKITNVDVNGLAEAGDYSILVSVDDATNEYTLTLNSYKGVYPVWSVYANAKDPSVVSVRSTKQVLKGVIRNAGDYTVEARVGNHNGISEGVLTSVIHISKDLADPNKFYGFKYDSEFNEWKNANVSVASTWFADDSWNEISAPDINFSNDLITFHTPAQMGGSQWQGQVHVVSDIPVSAEETYDFSCYIYAIVDTKVTVKVQKDGDDDTLFQGTGDVKTVHAGGEAIYFSDLPGFDGNLKIAFDFGGNPDTDFEISNIVFKNHKNDDGTVLPSEEEDVVVWTDADSDSNLWNSGNITEITSWTSPSDWSGSTPEPTITQNGRTINVKYTDAPGPDQWMGQVVIHTDMAFSGDKTYDFRVIINPSCDIKGATVKPTVEDDDNTFWSDGRHDLIADFDNVIELKGVSAQIPQFKLVFDFAGAEANANIDIKDIIIQERKEFTWILPGADTNLWKSNNVTEITTWTSPSDWSGSTPEPTVTQNGESFIVKYTDAPGPDQWMGQVVFHTDLSFSGDKTYAFRVTIIPSCDIPQATVKPTVEDDDNTFWSDGRHDLYADVENVIELKGVKAEIPKFKLVFDFAGAKENSTIEISDLIIQEY